VGSHHIRRKYRFSRFIASSGKVNENDRLAGMWKEAVVWNFNLIA
jgi:hypothetical protein